MISHRELYNRAKPICIQYGVNPGHLVSIMIRESLAYRDNKEYFLNNEAVGDSGKSWGLGQIYEPTRMILNAVQADNQFYWFDIDNAIKESSRLIRDIQNKIKSDKKQVTLKRICAGYNAGQSRIYNPPESTKNHYIPYVLQKYEELYGIKKKITITLSTLVIILITYINKNK